MKDAATRLLEQSVAQGAAAAESLIKVGATRTVAMEASGNVSWTRTAEGGIALRVFLENGAVGFASACGPHPDGEAIGHLVAAALDAARDSRESIELPRGDAGTGRGLGIFDPRLHAATPADLEGLLDEAVREALRADPRVRRAQSASIAASSSEIWMQNTSGLAGGYRQTLVHLSLDLSADDASGASAVTRRSRTARSLAAFSPALFGDETARLAIIALGGGPSPRGSLPAVFGPAPAADLLRQLAAKLIPPGPEAGSPVGSRLLNIIDDGRLPGGVASAPFDGEGTPTRRTLVVSAGRFCQMPHDLASAARWGACSTGNAVRPSFRAAPRRMTTNLFIAPGSDPPQDLMATIGEGAWIQSLRPTPAMTGHDESLLGLAAGRCIKAGRPAGAFAGVPVVCPLPALLDGIRGVGNDLTFGLVGGSFGAPSILVQDVELGAPR